MTWAPSREPQKNFDGWHSLLREFGVGSLLHGSDAWAFDAVIHLQSLFGTDSTLFTYRVRAWLMWSSLRSNRAKLLVAERIADGYTNDGLTANQAREELRSAGLWPHTLAEAGLIEDIPRDITEIEDNNAFHIALDSYRKNRL